MHFSATAIRGLIVAVVLSCQPVAQGREEALPTPAKSESLDAEVASLIQTLIEETEKNPQDGAAFGRLGLAYEANAMPKAARDAFLQASTLQPKEPRWPYHQARMEMILGDPEAAFQAIDVSLELEKGYAPAHRLRGDWLLDTGRPDEAQKSFQAVLALEPKSVASRIGIARAHTQKGENEAAIQILEEILDEGPGDAYVFQLLGNALRRSGKHELSKEAFARASNPVEPRWPDPWRDEREQYAVGFAAKLERASALAAGPAASEGIRNLEELRAANPSNAALLTNLGAAYCKIGRIDEGIEALQAAVRERPEHSSALINLSQAYETKGRMQEALDAASKAVQSHPELVHAHLRKGFLLSKLGRKEEALKSFEAARRVDARSASTLFWCGAMHSELQRWPEAVADFEGVLAQEPRMIGTYVWLARAKAEAGDLPGARAALREAEKQNPPPPELVVFRQRIEEIERSATVKK